MKKLAPLAIVIILLLMGGGYVWYNNNRVPSDPAVATEKYGSEIQRLSATIAEKKCEAGEETYINLAQDYMYTKEYKRVLATYDALKACYPNAYDVLSDKKKLLMHNIGALYEDWGYYLKEQKDFKNSEKKYLEAVKIFKDIMQVFKNSTFLSKDEIEGYENRIAQIEKYHIGQ